MNGLLIISISFGSEGGQKLKQAAIVFAIALW